MDAVAGYRREALPDPESVGEDDELVGRDPRGDRAGRPDHLRPVHGARALRARPRLLPAPGAGTRPAGADFLTAPEAHPIFGAAIGRLLEQAWDALGRPSPFTVTEPGAGTGALAAGLLGGLRDLGSPLLEAIRYRPVEVEPAPRSRPCASASPPTGWTGRLTIDGGPRADGVGAVVANEVLDALPVHRVVGRDGGLRELLVGVDGAGDFAWLEAEPSDAGPRRAPRSRGRGPRATARSPRSASPWTPGSRTPRATWPAAWWSSSTTPPSPRTSTAPPTPTAPSGRSRATRWARTRSGTSAARTSPPPWTWPRSVRPPPAPAWCPSARPRRRSSSPARARPT